MNIRCIALASALSAMPVLAANAQAVSGWYYSMGLGANIMNNENGTISVGGYSVSGDIHPDAGFAALLNIGWGFGNGLRAEGEVTYRENAASSSSGLASASVREEKAGLMMNVLYDFTAVPAVKPYVGVGVGFQEQWLNASASAPSLDGAFASASGQSTSFAYQAIAGVAVPL
jgi:opacity protein-like surface antigen